MKFYIPVVAIAAASYLNSAEIHPAQSGGLTVHEWGTFTSVAGEDGAPVDWSTLGCKSDLPKFVNDFGYRNFKFNLRGTVRMETPVLYFYSSRELDAHVKVMFPKGLITEWYPKAENSLFKRDTPDGSMRPLPANLNGIDTSLETMAGAIEWKNVHIRPSASPALPTDGGASHYYAARSTDSAPVTVGDQDEKFLFYRGVGRFPIPLAARIAGEGRISIENRGRDPVPGAILFENREGRIGYRNAGAVNGAVTLDAPALDASLPQLRAELEALLIAQGLYPKEAQAMVDTWWDSWFEEGTRLIYIVPSSAVDAILPLQVEPLPVQTVRVFVGRIELITSAVQRSVESAIAKHDWRTLDRNSRFLSPILSRIYAGKLDQAYNVENQLRDFQRSIGACR